VVVVRCAALPGSQPSAPSEPHAACCTAAPAECGCGSAGASGLCATAAYCDMWAKPWLCLVAMHIVAGVTRPHGGKTPHCTHATVRCTRAAAGAGTNHACWEAEPAARTGAPARTFCSGPSTQSSSLPIGHAMGAQMNIRPRTNHAEYAPTLSP
jgi:hypothetical protein